MALTLTPVTISAARRFVGEHHRHSRPPVGGLFAVGAEARGQLVAVGIAARPVARTLDDGATIEVVRCCTTGEPNAASMIYGALTRAAKALGYRRAVTYTLASESGASLRASGWRYDGLRRHQSWDRPNRARPDRDLFGERRPPGDKRRWSKTL